MGEMLLDFLVPREEGTLFIDDKRENCQAAQKAGLRPIWAHPACDISAEVQRARRQYNCELKPK